MQKTTRLCNCSSTLHVTKIQVTLILTHADWEDEQGCFLVGKHPPTHSIITRAGNVYDLFLHGSMGKVSIALPSGWIENEVDDRGCNSLS